MHGTNIKIFSIYFSSSYRKKLKPTPDPLSFAVSLDSFLNGAVHQQQMAGLVIEDSIPRQPCGFHGL